MPGAGWVRATERDAARYWWLTTNLREHCDTFLTAPGVNSLHFWTGIPPVSTLNTTLWPILLDDGQQARVLAAARSVARLCVAWDRRRMDVLMRTPETASRPLVAWLAREFEPQAAFGDWEFRVRRGSRPQLSYQGMARRRSHCRRVAATRARSGHARRCGRRRREANPRRQRDGPDVVAIDENGAEARIQGGIDVSRQRRIVLRGAFAAPSSDGAAVVVRLWGSDGRSLAIVPVVADGSSDTPQGTNHN